MVPARAPATQAPPATTSPAGSVPPTCSCASYPFPVLPGNPTRPWYRPALWIAAYAPGRGMIIPRSGRVPPRKGSRPAVVRCSRRAATCARSSSGSVLAASAAGCARSRPPSRGRGSGSARDAGRARRSPDLAMSPLTDVSAGVAPSGDQYVNFTPRSQRRVRGRSSFTQFAPTNAARGVSRSASGSETARRASS